MDNMKEYIAKIILDRINSSISYEEILEKIEVPKLSENGDFAFPCFCLAKVLKKSPIVIADELNSIIARDEKISDIKSVNGYLNFYLNSKNIVSDVLLEILDKGEKYGFVNIGNNENIVLDYSSPNIAKPFHLGHFRTTIIGRALNNLYRELGYNTIRINHLGDWGRQFGLLIEGYNLFKNEYDIEKNPLHTLSDIYVRINKLAKDDEEVMNRAREHFKKLEEGDNELVKLWQYFRDVSLKEYERIYKFMDCEFDSYNGEAFYNDKMDEVVDILDKAGVLKESQGAKVVEVENDAAPCIILKSNGSTIYATRDLAAILYRARTYDFKKAIYVTGSEQSHHFKQVFFVSKYIIGEKSNGLIHVPYGMVRLKTGKMSTREGTVIYLQDMIDAAIKKAEDVINNKNPNLENREDVAKKVGLGALIFNDLKHNKIKDIVFDLDEIIRFDGETGPYVQYTYVRANSVINKSGFNISELKDDKLCLDLLNTKEEVELIKEISKFSEIIQKSAEEYEPSILSRYLIDIASMYSRFYNECSILNAEDEKIKKARVVLCYATSVVLKKGLGLLGISCPDKM